jgi:hypothetical protein
MRWVPHQRGNVFAVPDALRSILNNELQQELYRRSKVKAVGDGVLFGVPGLPAEDPEQRAYRENSRGGTVNFHG